MGSEMPRFSDDMLLKLQNEFNEHVTEHRAFVERFTEHETTEEAWQGKQGERLAAILDTQAQNTAAISDLTKAVASVVSDTKDIVQLQKDVQAAARLGGTLQRFLAATAKWGLIGAGVAAGVNWILTHFKVH